MPDDLPTVSERAILSWAGPLDFRLGRVISSDGQILHQKRSANVIEALCREISPRPYRVRVVLSGNDIESASCTCSIGETGHCPHVAATLIAYSKDPERFGVAVGLDAALERRSKSELIELINRLLALRPGLEDFPETFLATRHPDQGLLDPATCRRYASFAFQVRHCDYDSAIVAADDLERSLEQGDEYLALEDFRSALIVYSAIAAGILDCSEIVTVLVDCDNGELAAALNHCITGLAKGLAGAAGDAAIRNKALRTLLELHLHDVIYSDSLFAGKSGALIKEHASGIEKALLTAWIRADMPVGLTWPDHIDRQLRGRFLLELAQGELDEDACLQICRESGLAIELADRLLQMGRLDDALDAIGMAWGPELPELGELFDRHGKAHSIEPSLHECFESSRDSNLAEWLKTHYIGYRKYSRALPIAEFLFERDPGASGYRELRELALHAGQWENIRLHALHGISTSGQINALANEYIDEGEVEPALELAGHAYLGAHVMKRLIRAVEAVATTSLREAPSYFRCLAEIYIELRGRKNYKQACRQLISMRDLLRRLGRDSDWQGFLAELRRGTRNRPALQDEMLRSGL